MFRIASSLVTVVLAAVPAVAQQSTRAMNVDGQRTDSMHLVAVMEGSKMVAPVGAAFLSYCPAVWKPEYANQDKIDEMTIGHLFRLGRNNWATIDNLSPMVFGNVTVPVGIWYIGVARDSAGKWSLVFIEPAKAKAAGIMPFAADAAPRAYEVPLTVAKDAGTTETMSVKLVANESEPAKGTFTIAFGNMKATAAYELKTAPMGGNAKDAAGRKK